MFQKANISYSGTFRNVPVKLRLAGTPHNSIPQAMNATIEDIVSPRVARNLTRILSIKHDRNGDGVYLPYADATRLTLSVVEMSRAGCARDFDDFRFYLCFPSLTFIHYSQFAWCDQPDAYGDMLKSSSGVYVNDPRQPESIQDPGRGTRAVSRVRHWRNVFQATSAPPAQATQSREEYNLSRGGLLYLAPSNKKRKCSGRK